VPTKYKSHGRVGKLDETKYLPTVVPGWRRCGRWLGGGEYIAKVGIFTNRDEKNDIGTLYTIYAMSLWSFRVWCKHVSYSCKTPMTINGDGEFPREEEVMPLRRTAPQDESVSRDVVFLFVNHRTIIVTSSREKIKNLNKNDYVLLQVYIILGRWVSNMDRRPDLFSFPYLSCTECTMIMTILRCLRLKPDWTWMYRRQNFIL